MYSKHVEIPVTEAVLQGTLTIPEHAETLIIFSHGSGSSHRSPRNKYVAGVLQEEGLATLLFDLLEPEEDLEYRARFNIPLLTERLLAAIEWARAEPGTSKLTPMLFGASTGAASALRAAAMLPGQIPAVVSRGGRVDLAYDSLEKVDSAVLLIVGELDFEVMRLNRKAMSRLPGLTKMEVVSGASHLFEETGKLEQVARTACSWFMKHSRHPSRVSV
jgi:pimeloyl-ACP methyl ester carboxylesterase